MVKIVRQDVANYSMSTCGAKSSSVDGINYDQVQTIAQLNDAYCEVSSKDGSQYIVYGKYNAITGLVKDHQH